MRDKDEELRRKDKELNTLKVHLDSRTPSIVAINQCLNVSLCVGVVSPDLDLSLSVTPHSETPSHHTVPLLATSTSMSRDRERKVP